MDDLGLWLAVGFAGLVVLLLVRGAIVGFRNRRRSAESIAKAEAFFQASFPELQPHLHPENVAAYVLARSGKQFAKRREWQKPPGFAAATLARYGDSPKGELTTLLDAAGNRLLDFVLEPKSGALGAVRVGQGKFTVRQGRGQPPRVSYWHPEHEFEWKGPGRWKFSSRIADETIDTSDPMWVSSSPSSSWSSSSGGESAFQGQGGTFDGGGASGGWDDDKSGSSGGSGGASATAY